MSVVPRDCLAHARGLVSFEAARLTAMALVRPRGRSERVPLGEARGRILATRIVAPRSLPAFDQAAMDGYALRLGGMAGLPLILPVSGKTEAGDMPGVLVAGTAHRITTGAALPAGADTVVMQEDVSLRGEVIQLPSDLPANSHVRRAGEDVMEGAPVLEAGRVLGWPEIALLAALGMAEVPVAATVRVAVLTTGSELHRAGEEAPAGGIYDSNSPMLAALLAAPGVVVSTVSVGDELDGIARMLAELSESADLVVTTAGVADGARDHVRAAVMQAGGTLDVVRVAMKPGKPLVLGRIGGAAFIGLPGNPQAAAFAAIAFVRPMIDRLCGARAPRRLTARLGFAASVRPGRTELLPVRLACTRAELAAERTGPAGSHRLLPMTAADAVAILPGSKEQMEAGTLVEILPFDRPRFER
jgi:molybdopterin molybdotransferase